MCAPRVSKIVRTIGAGFAAVAKRSPSVYAYSPPSGLLYADTQRSLLLSTRASTFPDVIPGPHCYAHLLTSAEIHKNETCAV